MTKPGHQGAQSLKISASARVPATQAFGGLETIPPTRWGTCPCPPLSWRWETVGRFSYNAVEE